MEFVNNLHILKLKILIRESCWKIMEVMKKINIYIYLLIHLIILLGIRDQLKLIKKILMKNYVKLNHLFQEKIEDFNSHKVIIKVEHIYKKLINYKLKYKCWLNKNNNLSCKIYNYNLNINNIKKTIKEICE